MADLTALVASRYGADTNASTVDVPADLPPAAGPVLRTLLDHRSVRQFDPHRPVPANVLDLVLAAAQSAPSSCNLQTWSVVAVADAERKSQIAALSQDQQFIKDAPLFLLFVADLHRMGQVAAAQHQPAGDALAYTDMFLTASLDAGFAAQNAVVAIESLGLGCCYVGAARNHPTEVAAIVGLPERAIGILGLSVGYRSADCSAAVKPRLPAAEILHRERWDNAEQPQHLAAYDGAMTAFNAGQGRSHILSWSLHSLERVATTEAMQGRDQLRPAIHERGFELK